MVAMDVKYNSHSSVVAG